jgi:hypothetical protein
MAMLARAMTLPFRDLPRCLYRRERRHAIKCKLDGAGRRAEAEIARCVVRRHWEVLCSSPSVAGPLDNTECVGAGTPMRPGRSSACNGANTIAFERAYRGAYAPKVDAAHNSDAQSPSYGTRLG